MRVIKYIAFLFVAVIATGLLFLIIGIPSDFLIDKIRVRFAEETGYQLQIAGGAKLSFWPSTQVVVRDITLVNPGERATQLTIGSARIEIETASLFKGQMKITEFALVKPVARMPLLRRAAERNGGAEAKSGGASAPKRQFPDIGRVIVEDGTVIFMRPGDRPVDRIDHINLTALLTQPDHRLDAKISAKAGAQDLHAEIKSKGPIESGDKPLPLELSFEAPGLLDGKLSSTANVTSVSQSIKINDLEGTIGTDRFTGWASVDLTSKPKVKVDLDFKRLSLAAVAPEPEDTTRPSTVGEPWSDQQANLDDLNFIDAQLALSASEFQASKLSLAPVYVEASLVNGVLNLAFSNTGAYGGKADGIVTLDVSEGLPRQTLHLDLSGMRALPLLSALADFRELDGTMTGKIDVRASGSSQRAIMGGLAGTVDVVFRDGEIRSINIAQTVRNLTQNTQKGWNENKSEKTDLTELSALFKINAGQAKTDNLKLLGPLVRVNGTGTADLAAKTLQFKLDTKLVMTLQGQGGPSDAVGFGVPVMVEGKWDSPQIYPDMAGILDNPDAAYAKLHELGQGLFGKGSGGTGDNSFFKNLGDFFKGGDRKDGSQPPAGNKPPASQDDQPKDAQAKDAQSKDAPAKDGQAQNAPAKDGDQKDTSVDDTSKKINDMLKNFFGK